MPRQEKIISKSGIHHVMLSGINGQFIGEEAEVYMRFLRLSGLSGGLVKRI